MCLVFESCIYIMYAEVHFAQSFLLVGLALLRSSRRKFNNNFLHCNIGEDRFVETAMAT